MVALQRDDFVLALFRGQPSGGTLYEICVSLNAPEVEGVRARLPEEVSVEDDQPAWFSFVDPFGFRWSVQEDGRGFGSSREIAGRWIS
jgi:hypothetical protein